MATRAGEGPEPNFDDAEEPLKVNNLPEQGAVIETGPDATSDSDAASAPSGPGQAL